MSPARLWLVRHAPVLAPPGTCYGQLDLPADPQATLQSARALATALPRGAVLHHSTLQRCELLAQSTQALRPDLILKPDARLRELGFGRWEGRPWAALARAELDAWTAQLATYPPGGGERLTDMLARVGAALHDACAAGPAGDVVWISHAGVARCVQWLLGASGRAPDAAEWPADAPAPGAWAHYPLPARTPV